MLDPIISQDDNHLYIKHCSQMVQSIACLRKILLFYSYMAVFVLLYHHLIKSNTHFSTCSERHILLVGVQDCR